MKQLSKVFDSIVVDTEGNVVGAVDEMILSLATGRISTLVILRPDRSRFCLSWDEVSITDRHFVLRQN